MSEIERRTDDEPASEGLTMEVALEAWCKQANRADDLEERLRRIADLHIPVVDPWRRRYHMVCGMCAQPWPCDTVTVAEPV